MPRKYAIAGTQHITSIAQTVLGVGSGTTVTTACNVYYVGLGSVVDAPADAVIQFTIRRSTARGTYTAVTPLALEPNDLAAASIAGENHTVEPTLAGVAYLELGMNLRATFQYQAAPGSELGATRTAANGIETTLVHADSTTNEVACTMHFFE